jgi:soluble cytochrome b562
MDAEMVKWLGTLGVGGVVAGMMAIMMSAQAKAHKAEFKAHAEAQSTALLAVNERLEHIINTSRQERQSGQEALITTIKESATVHREVGAIVAAHQEVLHNLRDVLRDLKR